MYISRVELDVSNHQKIKNVFNLAGIHSWVENSFPEEIKEKVRSRKLWRIDEISKKKYLLIISESKPNLKILEENGVQGSCETRNYDNYLNGLKKGMRYKFRVTLNPVKSISTGKKSGKRGRKFPQITEEQQLDYLSERANKNGFTLNENEYGIVERKYEHLKKQGKNLVKLSVVTYQGELEINDVEVFKQMLVSGLGGKKAYGCGMMTVIPIGR